MSSICCKTRQMRWMFFVALVCSAQFVQHVQAEEEEEADVPPPPNPSSNNRQPERNSPTNHQNVLLPPENDPVLIDSSLETASSYDLTPPNLMKPKPKGRPYYEIPAESINSNFVPRPQMTRMGSGDVAVGPTAPGSSQLQTKIEIPTRISVKAGPVKQQSRLDTRLSTWALQNKIQDFGQQPTKLKLKPVQQKKQQFQVSQKTMSFASSSYSEPYWPQWAQNNCPRSVCPNQNAYLAHPDDCCAFIVCQDCVPHYMRCAPNTQYNPFYRTCTYPYQSQCTAPNQDCHATANEYGSGNLKM